MITLENCNVKVIQYRFSHFIQLEIDSLRKMYFMARRAPVTLVLWEDGVYREEVPERRKWTQDRSKLEDWLKIYDSALRMDIRSHRFFYQVDFEGPPLRWPSDGLI
jgi:hypothetical protein